MAGGRQRGSGALALILTFAALAGCGRASLVITLRALDGDHPFDVASRIEAAVIAGDDLFDVASLTVTPGETSGSFDLEPVPRREDLQVLLTGYDFDGEPVAAGEAAPGPDALGGACCLDVCFCTLARFDGGACTCGSDGCGSCP